MAVHPRACGEHLSILPTENGWNGSSPRVRGTLEVSAVWRESFRFIPARAGNTRSLSGVEGVIPVHPRACGEHKTLGETVNPLNGSSPRVRGTLACADVGFIFARFIPARAGNTNAIHQGGV